MVNRNKYIKQMQKARDEKVRNHLSQYAPLWLAHEEADADKDTLIFDVVFQHPSYRWVKRRYFFDYYSDVLHHRGQLVMSEDDVVDIIATDPFIESASSNSVLSYGG